MQTATYPEKAQACDVLRLMMQIGSDSENYENCVGVFVVCANKEGWPQDKIEAFLPQGYSLREWPWNFSSWPVSKTTTKRN